MKKKALAVLYSPKTLYDFIWYYATYGKGYEWDVLCLPYGEDIKIARFCQDTGIFNKIFCHKTVYKNNRWSSHVCMFASMLLYWILGRSHIYAKKKIEQVVGYLDYSLHVVGHQDSLMAGCFFVLANKIRTTLLEDGTGEYALRYRRFTRKGVRGILNLEGFILAKMGYADITQRYWIKNFQYCDNFVVHPEKMQEHGYRSIRKIRDFSSTDREVYNELLQKAFSLNGDVLNGDIVLFTAPMDDFTTETDAIWDRTTRYLQQNYPGARVIVKKHPRDRQKIGKITGLSLVEVDPLIPGEVLLESICAEQYLFMFPSALLMDDKIHFEQVKILFYQDLHNDAGNVYCLEKIKNYMETSGILEQCLVVV